MTPLTPPAAASAAPRAAARGISRRRVLAGLAMAPALGALSACAQGWGPAGAPPNGKVQLHYWQWDPDQAVGYRASFDEFQKQNPNIEVVIENTPYGNYHNKIIAAFVSHTEPDLFDVNTPFLGTFINDGILMDLTQLIKRDNFDLTQYYPQLVDLHSRNGKIYGLPKDWDTIAMFYNKDYFKKVGVAARNDLHWNPVDGGTWLPYLKSLTTDKKGRNANDPNFDAGNIATYALGIPNDIQSGWGNYLAMAGVDFLDKPYGSQIVFDTPAGVQAMNFLFNKLVAEHAIIPPAGFGTNAGGDNAQLLFSQGRIAMYHVGDWLTRQISTSVTFGLGVMPLPAGPRGRISVLNGLVAGISAHTKHPEETWKLQKWIGSEESQTIMANRGLVWPAIQKLDPLFLDYWKGKGIDLQPYLDEAHGKTVNFPVAPGIAQWVSDSASILAAPLDTGSDVGPALANAAARGNYLLSTS